MAAEQTDHIKTGVEKFLSAMDLRPDTPWSQVIASVASPIHRGVGHSCIRVEPVGGTPVFLKIVPPDQNGMKNPSADRIARIAGELKIAPSAIETGNDNILSFAVLCDAWRTAKVSDLRDPHILSKIIETLSQLHSAEPIDGIDDYDMGDRLNQLDSILRTLSIDRPPEYDWMMDQAKLALSALNRHQHKRVMCHLGAISSNIMLKEGMVHLVGFNQSALSDPLHDFGVLLTEAFDFEDEWKSALAPIYGVDVDAAVHRARLWGIVDDLCWGQWALISHINSPLSDVEFFKYASWRFMRAKMNMSAPEFERRLRQTN